MHCACSLFLYAPFAVLAYIDEGIRVSVKRSAIAMGSRALEMAFECRWQAGQGAHLNWGPSVLKILP